MMTIDSTITRRAAARLGMQVGAPFAWRAMPQDTTGEVIDNDPTTVVDAVAVDAPATESATTRPYANTAKGNLCPIGRTTKHTARLLRRRRICRT